MKMSALFKHSSCRCQEIVELYINGSEIVFSMHVNELSGKIW